MKNKKLLFTIFLVFWMIVIFLFSNQPANISEGNSDAVTSKAIDVVTNITKKDVTENKRKSIIKNTRFLVRKTAHFTLYFVLNIFIYFTLKFYGVKNCFIYSILFSFLFACTDEFHQLFIADRTGRFLDVLIDTSGAFCSSLLIRLINGKKIRNPIK